MAKNTEHLGLIKPESIDFYNIEDFNENFDKIDEFSRRKDNPHGVTKEQVGLGDVDNTPDANKPVSTAQAAAIQSVATSIGNSIGNHTSNKSNPHNVTADQIGAVKKSGDTMSGRLSVPGVTISDRSAALESGERISMHKPNSDYDFDAMLFLASDNRLLFSTHLNQEYEILNSGHFNSLNIARVQSGTYVGNGNAGSGYPNRLDFKFPPKIVIIEGRATDTYHNYKCIFFRVNTIGVVYTFKGASGYEFNNVNVTWTNNTVQWYQEGSNGEANAVRQLNGTAVTYNYIAIG